MTRSTTRELERRRLCERPRRRGGDREGLISFMPLPSSNGFLLDGDWEVMAAVEKSGSGTN